MAAKHKRKDVAKDDPPHRTANRFVGVWEVTAGGMRSGDDRKHFAVIVPADGQVGVGDYFNLFSLVGEDCKFHQTLLHMVETHTLENRPGERERCIVFWGRKKNGAERNSIFAKRIKIQDPLAQYSEQSLLPWESRNDESVDPPPDPDNGTWGAEGG